jgi:hypothetical protein
MTINKHNIEVRGSVLRIAGVNGDGYRFIDDPNTFLNEARSLRPRVDIVTFMQGLPETKPKFDFPMEWDNFAAIPLTTFENWWDKQIGFKARNKAKQAERKGVVVKEVPFDDKFVDGIWKIYNECPVRQGRRFTHYGKKLDQVYREEATFLDSSIFIGAYIEDEMVGFIKLVHDERKIQAGLMNIVAMIRHRDKAVTNALVAQAVRSCTDRQIRYLVYSNFAYGKKGKDSITDFKERNAFERFDVPRYYVPLTFLGKFALRFGFHKRLADRIPESLLGRLRGFRNTWNNRKLKSVSEAV